MAHRRAGGSSPPLLETLAEDEDAERKEEESVGEPECGEDDGAPAMEEAVSIQRQIRGAGGNVWSRKRAVVWGQYAHHDV